jgi:hypothetical protein
MHIEPKSDELTKQLPMTGTCGKLTTARCNDPALAPHSGEYFTLSIFQLCVESFIAGTIDVYFEL